MKKNEYIIENNLITTDKIQKNIIYPINKKEDKVLLSLLVDILPLNIKDNNKYDLNILLSKLYNMTLKSKKFEYKNNFLIILEVEYLQFSYFDDKQQGEILDLINLFTSFFEFKEEDVEVAVQNLIIYYNEILDNLNISAINNTIKLIYRDDPMYMSISEKIYYLENNESIYRELIELGKEIFKAYFYILKTNESNLNLQSQGILKEYNLDESKISFEKEEINDIQSEEQVSYVISYQSKEMIDNEKINLFNMIFGGEFFSKLFVNVREEKHICYSISSQVINNNIILVAVELNKENIEIAYNEINKQMKEIISGNIPEFEMAKEKMINNYLKNEKNMNFQNHIIFKNKIDEGMEQEFEEVIEKIKQISEKDMIEISQKFEIIKIYSKN